MREDLPFNMADVAGLVGLQIKRRGSISWEAYCPFCQDEKGKMNLNLKKNVFRCNRCGESGGMLDLYGKLYHVDHGTACSEIKELLGRETEKKPYKIQAKKVEQKIPEIPQAEAAGIEACNKTYTRMLEMLPLAENHRTNLLERGFSEEKIEENGYKSTLVFGYRKLAERLLKAGCTLQGVPGFYQDKEGRWTVNFSAKNAGFLVPVRNMDGLITAMQIRLDHPYDGRKYVWFSSANYQQGITSGSPVHFVGQEGQACVFVTEGPLKADLSHYLSGRTFAAVAGVNLYGNLSPVLERLKQTGTKKIYEAYDMDKHLPVLCRRDYKEEVCSKCELRENGFGSIDCPRKKIKLDNIQRGCRNLYRLCEENGLESSSLTWDMNEKGIWKEKRKGVDDYLYALKKKEESEKQRKAGTGLL